MTLDRFNWSSQCDGKEQYATRGLADRVAARRNKTGRNLQVYRCGFCGAWHMGKRPKTVRHPREEEAPK